MLNMLARKLVARIQRGHSVFGHTNQKSGRPPVGERKIADAPPAQLFEPVLGTEEIEREFAALSPEIPWCHYFKIGPERETVDASGGRYFEKATALKTLAVQVLDSIPYITRRGSVQGLSVLDLACAEGQHSIELAMAGAGKVCGIEGRQLYVDRANFIARCFGADQAQFRQHDVRTLSPDDVGTFELVLFFGILHHLDKDDFFPMLRLLRTLTNDALLLYTHTVSDVANARFGTKLGDEVTCPQGYEGRLFREHPDSATPEQRAKRVRSSIDNTFSFWARETELLRAAKDAGFNYVAKQLYPNPYPNPVEEYRVIYVCRV